MPSRLISLGIVAFWLATSAWLFQRELWPRLKPNEPPPYTIDLVDEAREHAAPSRWTVYRDGQKIGKATTAVAYNDRDDSFDLLLTMEHLEVVKSKVKGSLVLAKAKDTLCISRQGELKSLAMDLAGNLVAPDGTGCDYQAEFRGAVAGRSLNFAGFVDAGKMRRDIEPEPQRVSAYGTVFHPLHPVNRMRGLRQGQTWRLPLVDPLSEVYEAAAIPRFKLPGLPHGPSMLIALVSEPRPLAWGGAAHVPCLVIEYEGNGGTVARTWVRESDGLVLRQEATVLDVLIVFQRDF